jgi:hypothetical protein
MNKIRHIHGHPFHKRRDPGLGMLLWPKCPVQASPPHTPLPPFTIWASINVYHQCFLLEFYCWPCLPQQGYYV